MKKTTTQLPEIKLVGITCRTNNAKITDFEVYDDRSSDHLNTVLDIYIGLASK